jgi:hypothetical protein
MASSLKALTRLGCGAACHDVHAGVGVAKPVIVSNQRPGDRVLLCQFAGLCSTLPEVLL